MPLSGASGSPFGAGMRSTMALKNIINTQSRFCAGRNNVFALAANQINNLIFHHFRIGTVQDQFYSGWE